jgi:transposase
MRVKSILNRVEKNKLFVCANERWGEGQELLMEMRPRVGSRPICSGCGEAGPGYDTLPQRRFEFVPLWGIPVFYVYARRRVECSRCGIKVEKVPWAEGKETLTRSYMQFLAIWARRLSWQEVARYFHTSWEQVFRSVSWMVEWGLAHRDLAGIGSLGIDEVLFHRGHRYLTVVYQIDAGAKRLLWVGLDRTTKTLLRFFRSFGKERSAQLRFICSDLWQPYLKVVKKKAPQAVHVLDRFHVVKSLNQAVDQVRAQEVKELKEKGLEPVLTHSRWCVLKRPENLTEKQEVKLADLVRCNLKTARAYLLKEDFQWLWNFRGVLFARRFLKGWYERALRSRLEPMKKVARMLRDHEPLLLNWFRANKQISGGITEGLNSRLKLTLRKSYGFRTFRAAEIALYHTLGALPEPKWTHKFC